MRRPNLVEVERCRLLLLEPRLNPIDRPGMAVEANSHRQRDTKDARRRSSRGQEFFRCDLSTIRNEVEKLGLQSHWTMLAEATDYRETLAIEKKIAEDPLARERWMQRQLELDPTDGGRGEVIEIGAASDGDE